nr:VTT domain-containing protein [Bacillus sp. USDA818B3_A]
MKELTLQLFSTYEHIAFLLSIVTNIIISVLGIVPSVFLTAINLQVFGFWEGMFISFAGEALGAIISFVLYRKGFRKLSNLKQFSHPKVKRLLTAQGKESFFLILSLRLLPFVPSGVVTFFAAIGKTSILIFVIASSIGKIPAIMIEAYSTQQVFNWTIQGKVITTAIAILLIIMTWKKLREE